MINKILNLDELKKRNFFYQNQARYGNDYASYPIRMELISKTSIIRKDNIFTIKTKPGIKMKSPLVFAIYDHFNQRVLLDFWE